MRCRKIRATLGLFLDRQLNEDEALKVERHLAECPACKREAALLRNAWDLLGELKPIVPTPNFKSNFYKRLSQEDSITVMRPVFTLPRLKPFLVPALATLIMVLFIVPHLMNYLPILDPHSRILLAKLPDMQMVKELDLVEEINLLRNINILEDFEIIDSIELS